MDFLFQKQVDFILNRGQGVKACLFDEETKQTISNIIPYSKFQDNDFFYFDMLANKDRVAISDVSCVVIIRSTSLKLLIEELSSPFYGNYIVLFTNQIDPFVLGILANSDAKCLVSEVHEIYLDVYKQCFHLYTTNSTQYLRTLEALQSIIMSLEVAPSIRVYDGKKGDDLERSFASLGKELGIRSLQYNFPKAGTVLMMKRHFDPITPLMYDWHYQALIQEHLKMENGTVKIGTKTYSLDDTFFAKNKYCDIHTVGDNIKALVKELERNKIKISNHEFEDIEEKAAHSLMVETHLTIHNAILEKCMSSKEPSEAEMEILLGNSRDIKQHLEGLPETKRLKMLLLYFLKNVEDWESESKQYPDLREKILKYKEKYVAGRFPYKYDICNIKDIKLGYFPPLRRIIKHALQSRLSNSAFQSIGPEHSTAGPVIVYIEGGITMAEYREAMLYAAEAVGDVYLISDRILSYADILDEL